MGDTAREAQAAKGHDGWMGDIAREVIADSTRRTWANHLAQADSILDDLERAGLVVVPRAPSDAMVEAMVNARAKRIRTTGLQGAHVEAMWAAGVAAATGDDA